MDVARIEALNAENERVTLELCEELSQDAARELMSAQVAFSSKLADALNRTIKDQDDSGKEDNDHKRT